MKLALKAGDELVRELEYSKPGSAPAFVLYDGQLWAQMILQEKDAEPVVYTLEPVLDATTGEWVSAVVPEDQAEAVREAANARIAELDRMNLTLAGIVDDLKKQRAEHEAATVTVQKIYAAQLEELRQQREELVALRERAR